MVMRADVRPWRQLVVATSVVLPEAQRQIAVGCDAGRDQTAPRVHSIGVEMSTVPAGDRGRATRTALDNYLVSGQPDGDGLYLTNDVFLYRVVRMLASDDGAMVVLEDCYSLDAVRVSIREVHARRLRVVRAPTVRRPR